MSLSIRPASLSDVDLLRDFERKLISHEQENEKTLKQERELLYYDIPKLIEDVRNTCVLIAELDGNPVGCGFGQIRENDHFNQEKQYGYIGLMYVDESSRGNNVGHSIVQELVRWFHSRTIREIRLKVYASNPGAIKAYEKYGFEHMVHEMKLKSHDKR
jgi:ribosomal protein S18 acetylase RimI-like enzyme